MFGEEDAMRPNATDDRALTLIAEAILDASDEEITRVAIEHGVNVTALEQKVRTMIADRVAAADRTEEEIFVFLCQKYVQRADARQKKMGLQYTEAGTHDLAAELAKFFREKLVRGLTEE